MVSTRVFSGDVLATGDDLSSTAYTTILDDDDTEYDLDGVYLFMLWNVAADSNDVSASFLFRLRNILASSTREDQFAFGSGSDGDHIKVRRNGGLTMQRSDGPADNKWELVRIA